MLTVEATLYGGFFVSSPLCAGFFICKGSMRKERIELLASVIALFAAALELVSKFL